MAGVSEYPGAQEQDPAERLAAALRRIAVGLERREAAADLRLEAVTRSSPTTAGAELPVIAASLDALIVRLRTMLNGMPAEPPQAADGGV